MLGDYKIYVNNTPTTRGWEEETEGGMAPGATVTVSPHSGFFGFVREPLANCLDAMELRALRSR